MTQYILHGDYLSPYTLTVAFTLLEKELTWTLQPVLLLNFETRTPDHRRKHPLGKVPVLDIIDENGGKLRIYESRAICRYLSLSHDKAGKRLMPEQKDLVGIAHFEEAASVETCYFTPNAWKLTGEILMKPLLGFGAPEPRTLAASWEALQDTLRALDGILAHRPYLAGVEFSLVDLWTMPWLAQVVRVKGEAEVLVPYTNVQAWWASVSSRPAWAKISELMIEACRVFETGVRDASARDT